MGDGRNTATPTPTPPPLTTPPPTTTIITPETAKAVETLP